MALSTGTPSSPFDHLITGTGSWDDLVTLISDTAAIEKVGNDTYIVKEKFRIEADLDALKGAVVISRDGGGWCLRSGGSAIFGEEITYNGRDYARAGCAIIEESSAWSKGANNYNLDTCRCKDSGSALTCYDTTWHVLATGRQDFDIGTGATFTARKFVLYMEDQSYNHFYCTIDWNDILLDHQVGTGIGSNFESNSSTTYTEFNGVSLYKTNGTTERQLVFFSAPSDPIVDYDGQNFARSSGSGTINFDNPIPDGLISVQLFGGSLVVQERRTLDVDTKLAGTGTQTRIVAEDDDGGYDVNSLTDSSGVLSTQLVRKRWAAGTHTATDKTPHIIHIDKYGYLEQIVNLDATPSGAGAGGFSLPAGMVADSSISQTKAAALAHTGISITYESSPVTWNSKDFSITVTGNTSTNPSLTASDIHHYIMASKEDGTTFSSRFPHAMLVGGTESARGEYYDGFKGVRIIDQSGNSFTGITRHQADDGTYYTVPTSDTFTITSSESSSFIQIFTAGTQTVLDSTTGTSLAYNHAGETVDYVVQKAGFLPQRFTSLTLTVGTSPSVSINLQSDPVYDSSHGLTYTTDASWSRSNNELTVPTFGPTVRQVYSLMIDAFIAQSALYNTAFNIQMNGPNSMFLIDDAEGDADSSIENMTDGGVRYVSTGDVATAGWCAVQSVGTATGFTGEYQQQDGSGTTDARASGAFDELIKIYGDATHGNFDYRSHLVLKYQVNGYREERVDVLDSYGITSLEETLYVIAMEPVAITASTGDPALTITITDHGASPVTWNGKDFSITITDNATPSTGENILRELNYNLSLDAAYQGKDPFNWPEMVKELGSAYDTLRGVTEGGTGAALKGVRVVKNDGTTPHPDFTRFMADDGTYYTPPTVANISAPNLTSGRIQIVNETGRTASAWAATTAYSLYNKVLRSTGTGSESGIGLYFQCTTAGTSGGSEPIWDTTPGNTTSDGTVTWTCRAIEFDNDSIAGSYSNSWTDHEDFDNGDTIRLRWIDSDEMEIEAEGVATSDGTTSFLNTPVDDTVYDDYGIDGSTVTEYAADYPNIQVDVTDPDNVFYLDRFYAWFKYNLTDADGIRNFFGGLSATDTSNLMINNSVVDIFFDNTKTSSARQGDNIVISRSDGAYPQVTVTSGGGGLGFYYTGIGYSTSSGSGLDTTERNKLLGLYDYDPTTQNLEGSVTYQEAQRLMLAEAAGKVAVSGSTVTFRDQADSKDRITATVDSNGQRTTVTTDAS